MFFLSPRKSRSAKSTRGPHYHRPRLEALEDRTLPSTLAAGPTAPQSLSAARVNKGDTPALSGSLINSEAGQASTATGQISAQAVYNFAGTLGGTGGVPSLSAIGAGQFLTDSVFGTSQAVYAFDQGSGLSLDTTGLIPRDDYSIELVFQFDDVSSWRKIVDFETRTLDNGLYAYNGQLQYYPETPGGSLQAGRYHHVVLTRAASDGTVVGYVDGTEAFRFTDAGRIGDIDNPQNLLNFFVDDVRTGYREVSSGRIALLRLYQRPLIPAEVQAAFSGGTVTPSISDMIAQVDALDLASNETNSLTSKLQAAAASLASANTTAAVNQLNALVNQIQALVKSNRLSETTANSFTDKIGKLVIDKVGTVIYNQNNTYIVSVATFSGDFIDSASSDALQLAAKALRGSQIPGTVYYWKARVKINYLYAGSGTGTPWTFKEWFNMVGVMKTTSNPSGDAFQQSFREAVLPYASTAAWARVQQLRLQNSDPHLFYSWDPIWPYDDASKMPVTITKALL